MPVNQPIELEVFVVVTERVDELFCDFEQTHVKEKLEDGIDWNVEVNVHGHSPAPHVLALFAKLYISSSLNTDLIFWHTQWICYLPKWLC